MNIIRFGEEDRQEFMTPRDAWLASRRGRITGTTLQKIVVSGGATKDQMQKVLEKGGVEYGPKMKKEELEALLTPLMKGELATMLPKKVGFFQLIAEKLGMPPDDDENQMERGARLERDGVQRFCEENPGLAPLVDSSLLIWTREDNEMIAVSPDAAIAAAKDSLKFTGAVECKCLASSRHIEAYVKRFIWNFAPLECIPDDYKYQVRQYFVVNDDLQELHFIFFDPRFAEIKTKVLDYFEITIKREDLQKEIDELLPFEQATIGEVNDLVNTISL